MVTNKVRSLLNISSPPRRLLKIFADYLTILPNTIKKILIFDLKLIHGELRERLLVGSEPMNRGS